MRYFHLQVPPKGLRSGKRAFTLIELLTVTTIILVLVSLLSVGMSKAKGTADSAVCKSNLRQVGLGLHLYLGDYGCYPPRRGRPAKDQKKGVTH